MMYSVQWCSVTLVFGLQLSTGGQRTRVQYNKISKIWNCQFWLLLVVKFLELLRLSSWQLIDIWMTIGWYLVNNWLVRCMQVGFGVWCGAVWCIHFKKNYGKFHNGGGGQWCKFLNLKKYSLFQY